MGLRDIGAALPPGFRFYPSDEELVCHYLYKKIANEEVLKGTLVEIDLHTCEPWQLPGRLARSLAPLSFPYRPFPSFSFPVIIHSPHYICTFINCFFYKILKS